MIGKQLETRRKFLKFGGGALAGSLWTFGPHSAVELTCTAMGRTFNPGRTATPLCVVPLNPSLTNGMTPI